MANLKSAQPNSTMSKYLNKGIIVPDFTTMKLEVTHAQSNLEIIMARIFHALGRLIGL
jgi:hypothetical protein